MSEVELNIKDFKTLASETRLQIIKALDGKNLSLNDIARITNLHRMTLHEHLEKLVETGYVKKIEREGHKWVYYKLSWKGSSILHPRKSKVMIIFSITIIVSMSIVSASILLNIKRPIEIDSMRIEFEGVRIEVFTDKDVYNVGEVVNISVKLINTNENDTILYCGGYKNSITDELFTMFNIKIFTETYFEIWSLDHPGKYNFPDYWPSTYTLSVNASSFKLFENVSFWNQTVKNVYAKFDGLTFEPGKQVPSGTYIVVVEVPIYFEHYFEGPYEYFEFGNSKSIIIK